MWANADPSELERSIRYFREFANLVLRSEMASVRNGLDHFRKPADFPSVNAMLACESRVRQAVETADVRRFAPKRWWLTRRERNYWGQVVEIFGDERRNEVEARYPSVLMGLREAGYGEAVVIAPGNLLGEANATIMFKVQEESAYLDMWKNYPARPVAAESPEPAAVQLTESGNGERKSA